MMSNKEIEEIVAYLNKLQDALLERDFSLESLQPELNKLNKVIEQLKNESAENPDENSRMFFASIEYNAEQFRNEILKRVAENN